MKYKYSTLGDRWGCEWLGNGKVFMDASGDMNNDPIYLDQHVVLRVKRTISDWKSRRITLILCWRDVYVHMCDVYVHMCMSICVMCMSICVMCMSTCVMCLSIYVLCMSICVMGMSICVFCVCPYV